MGQNVWRKVNPNGDDNTKLGELTGGGPDADPATSPGAPIFEHYGKYFIGPLGPDDEANYYYYGDPETGGDGLLNSTEAGLEGDDVIWYMVDGEMTTEKPDPSRHVGKKFTMDGQEWLIIKADNAGNLLITTTNVIARARFSNNRSGVYARSELKVLMDGYFTSNRWPTVFQHIRAARIPVETRFDRNAMHAPSAVDASSSTRVFALSVSDINTSYLRPEALRRADGGSYWLRTIGRDSDDVAIVRANGQFHDDQDARDTDGVRPAMWVHVSILR